MLCWKINSNDARENDMEDTLEAEDSAGTVSPGCLFMWRHPSVNKACTKFPTGGMYANLAQALLQSKNHFVGCSSLA